MAAARVATARARAVAVIEELGINQLPVSPEAIAAARRIVLEERDGFPPQIFGAFEYARDGFKIYVSSACPTPGHRRFTIAHELGHYHLDGHLDALMAGTGAIKTSLSGHYRSRKDPLEVEADAFASELLMPARLIRGVLGRVGRDVLGSALRLAKQAATSRVAAAVRVVEMADALCAVVVSHEGAIEWMSCSPALWEYDFVRRPWRGEWAPRGSGALRLAHDPDAVVAGASDGSTLLVCEWFDGAPETGKVEESSIGLGAYGRVLTVLFIPFLPDPDALYVRRQRIEDEELRRKRSEG